MANRKENRASAWQGMIENERMLWDIIVPGTHDSCAIDFDFSKATKNKILQIGCICRPIVRSFARTQEHTIDTQLYHGIRYIDIRVSQWDGEFFASHTFSCGILVNEVLSTIHTFLLKHPSEFILLHMVPDVQNGATAHDVYTLWRSHPIASIDYFSNEHRYPRTIGTMRGRILWLEQCPWFKSEWFDTNSASELDSKMNEVPGPFMYTSYVLTPTTCDVALSIATILLAIVGFLLARKSMTWTFISMLALYTHCFYRGSLKQMTESIQPKIYSHRRIVAMDFYSPSFIGDIIAYNLKANNPHLAVSF